MWIKWILFSQMQNRGEVSTTKYSDHNSNRTQRSQVYIFRRYEAISYQILSVDAPFKLDRCGCL